MLRPLKCFVLSYFFTFFGCATIDKNTNYLLTPAIRRSYTLPDNVSSWTTRVPYGFRNIQGETQLLTPTPWIAEWEFAISNSLSLVSRPLPLGIKWGYYSSDRVQAGFYFGSLFTFSMASQFRIQPTLEHHARFLMNDSFGIESNLIFESDLAMQTPPREASKGIFIKELYFLNQVGEKTLISPGTWFFASQGRAPMTRYFLENTSLSAETLLGWGIALKTQNRISQNWEIETLQSFSGAFQRNRLSQFYNELTIKHFW